MHEQPPEKKTRRSDPYTASDYEYVNSMSKSAWPALILTILISGAFYAFAFFRYRELARWQKTGGRIGMTSIESVCYNLGGIWLFQTFIVILATVLLIAGVRRFRHHQKLKRDTH